MDKKRIIFLSTIFILIVIASLVATYALDVGVTENTTTDYDLSYSFDIYSNTQKQVTIPAGKTKVFDIDITNPQTDTVKYGVAYSMVSPTTLPDGVTIAQSSASVNTSVGLIDADGTATVSIVVENTSTSSITIALSIINGYKNGGDLVVPTGKILITEEYEIGTGSSTATSEQTLTKLGLTVASGTPDFSKTSCSSGCDESTVGVYAAEDDLGTSYYFRGDVENNYVRFASFSWRIIRINGDGTIRMIYDGKGLHENGEESSDRYIEYSEYNINYDDNTYVGYMIGTAGATDYATTHSNSTDSTIKGVVDTWYKTNIVDTGYAGSVVDAIYCNDRSINRSISYGTGVGTTTTDYSAYDRLDSNSPTLKCSQKNDRFTTELLIGTVEGNDKLTYPVGLITTDELSMAGTWAGGYNESFYLYNGAEFDWTMSPSAFNGGFAYVIIGNFGAFGYHTVDHSEFGVRPVITLSSSAIQYGTGTSTDPFRLTSAI